MLLRIIYAALIRSTRALFFTFWADNRMVVLTEILENQGQFSYN